MRKMLFHDRLQCLCFAIVSASPFLQHARKSKKDAFSEKHVENIASSAEASLSFDRCSHADYLTTFLTEVAYNIRHGIISQ